jgi:hypothetical protein
MWESDMNRKSSKMGRTRYCRLLVVVALGLAAGVTWRLAETAGTRTRQHSAWQLVVVQPGDSLWSIAQRHGPRNRDPRAIVSEIRRINELSSADLRIGQSLVVPCNPEPRRGGEVTYDGRRTRSGDPA